MPPRRRSSRDNALKDYRRKRDFSRSPEPSGDRSSPKKTAANRRRRKLSFCVQKHLATNLHYDFRLEHNGTLLSWAVPKGPSLNPADKRLAMHVEDHPLDYGDFEGLIPEGYGAGIVMLWDRGTWTPDPRMSDVDSALRKGELKFTLDGVKLKGSWVLVHSKGRMGERGWLLIKHRDQWAGDLDITNVAPLSVKSFGDFEDIIAQEKPAIWESKKPALSRRGGKTGALLTQIIRKAERLRADSAGKRRREPAQRKSRQAAVKPKRRPSAKRGRSYA